MLWIFFWLVTANTAVFSVFIFFKPFYKFSSRSCRKNWVSWRYLHSEVSVHQVVKGGGVGGGEGGQDSSLTVVCNHVLPYLGPAFLWEFWFLLLHLEFEVPNDTEAAILYLKALVPLDKFEGKIPAIILKHQIYCVVKDRTLVDRQLVS